jgi:uncharacterized membrane protein YeaQ/YmgE (transglycosylase-associated protein family)
MGRCKGRHARKYTETSRFALPLTFECGRVLFTGKALCFFGVRGDTSMEALIIQLISGAVGGNAAGAIFKNLSLGMLGNTIAGVAGGGIGGQILGAVLPQLAGGMVGPAAGGGIGGLVLMAVVGFIKSKMAS